MARGRREHKTFHISVPLEDERVLEWLSKQYNQSASMRELIRGAIEEVGMVDLFTGRPYNRKPGQSGRAKMPPPSNNSSTIVSRKRRQKEYVAQRQASVDEMEKEARETSQGVDELAPVMTEPIRTSTPTRKSGGGIRMDESVLAELSDEGNKEDISETVVDDIQAMLDE